MTPEAFTAIVTAQNAIEKAILCDRAAAYATGGDRLGNFHAGARLNGEHPLRYGFGLVSKQIIALRDLIAVIDSGQGKFTDDEFRKLEEYITDIRNYMVLFKGIYLEEKSQCMLAATSAQASPEDTSKPSLCDTCQLADNYCPVYPQNSNNCGQYRPLRGEC